MGYGIADLSINYDRKVSQSARYIIFKSQTLISVNLVHRWKSRD